MKKTLLAFIIALILPLCSCKSVKEPDTSYLDSVFASSSAFDLRCGDVGFTFKNGTASFYSPDMLKGLTVNGGVADYRGDSYELPDDAFFVCSAFGKALLDFESSGKGFTVKDGGAFYSGYCCEITADSAVSPSSVTVTVDGIKKEYKIVSINA